ncbi:alpha-1,6-mannosyl-glycoprotein 4-beta-N-acetylglucosaminyltransferase-like [Tiliqua scincoides]|uniref:alpha-1,6-mannosyl-glycoprotein 4-beta-N-acetylglucosaminyltransferase-like n=1 Tax=Tiliqua scincoides TaxID=71010 RepID=UPI0034628DD4
MRCFLKRSLIAAISLALLLLVIINVDLWTQENPEMKELRRRAQIVGLQELHAEWNGQSFQRLFNTTSFSNISYHHLVGVHPLQKKVLTVGLCSIKRKRENYLLKTLRSIFKQSTEDELSKMVVVVHLADVDQEWNTQVAASVARNFAPQLLLGRLMVIHAPSEYYPPLEGLKRNYNDAEDRVRFRSKQNVDYAYLMNFAANLSTYYLMIEDDVLCSKSFFTAIMNAVASRKGSYWVMLEFSKLGYIGKLYHSSDLPMLVQFLILFYQEMPCDWLLGHFRLLLTQNEVIRFKPSLFQHIGLYSSFRGTSNKLKDDDFQEDPFSFPDNPPADIITDINTFRNYQPQNAYSNTKDYFWGEAPTAGNSFTLVFKQAAHISHIQIHTGVEHHPEDYLRAGLVQLGTQKISNGKDCATYTTIGIFERGHFDRQDLENSTGSAPECVRILVTVGQREWLIISSISIWTKHGS